MKRFIGHADLFIVIALSSTHLALVLTDADGVLRAASGLAFIAFLPGYALLAALYRPVRPDVTAFEHSLLAIPTSLAIVTVVGFALNTIGWTVSPNRDATWLTVLTVGSSLGAIILQRDGAVRTATGGLILATPLIAFWGMAVAGTTVAMPTAESGPSLALYVLDANGEIPEMPIKASTGQSMQFRVGIRYGGSETEHVTLTLPDGEERDVTLEPNTDWEYSTTVVAPTDGRHTFVWRLLGDSGSTTRRVSIWLVAN